MKDYTFSSALAPYMEGFLMQKRALGYKYEHEEYVLRNLDRYWRMDNGNPDSLSRDSIHEWSLKRDTETVASRSSRISVIRQLALYMNSVGKAAYVPNDRYIKPHSVIHVLSHPELVELFQVIDAYVPQRQSPEVNRMSREYKVLFRLILTTGLRKSEALCIHTQDIDRTARAIKIIGAKGRKDRIVYMSDDMAALLDEYLKYLCTAIGSEPHWLFPAAEASRHISIGAISQRFRKFWNMTSFASACEKPPTIHSLRHTYVVLRMNEWMLQGVDLQVMMPYLSRQLGHTSINETFYYYHQVEEAFSIIRRKDTVAAAVIPEARVR